MNIRQLAKKRLTNKPRFTIQYSPDLDHEAWRGSAVPTPLNEPDAFYKTCNSTTPVIVKQLRKKPHRALSICQLRRRLYAAGLRGERIHQVAHEIKAGPQSVEEFIGHGLVFMGWPESLLLQRYGRRITRAVTRFVCGVLVMVDECHHLVSLSPGYVAHVQGAMTTWRKCNARLVEVSQSVEQLAA